MFLDRIFARDEFLNYEIHCFRRRLNANCPAHHLVDCSRTCSAVDSRSTAGSGPQFCNNRVAERSFKKLRNNKQIGPDFVLLVPFCGSINRRAVTLSRARVPLLIQLTIAWRRIRYE